MLENEYDVIADELEGAQKSELKSADFATTETNPDQKAEAFKLADQYKVPVEFVESNFDEFKKKNTEVREDLYDDLATNYKATSKFLSDANNAGVAKDDIDSLKKIEDISKRSFSDTLASDAMSGLARINQSIVNIPAATYDLAVGGVPGRPGINQYLQMFGSDFRFKSTDIPQLSNPFGLKDYYKKSEEFYTSQSPDIDPKVLERAIGGDFSGAGEYLARQVAKNSPQMLFTIGSVLAGRPDLGLTGIGVVATSGEIQQAVESEKVDVATGVPAAVVKGATEVLTEKMGTFGFIDKMSKSLSMVIGKQGLKEVMKSFGKTMAGAFASEAIEEGSATAIQNFIDYSTGENPDAFQTMMSDTLNSMVVGGFSGTVMTGPATSMVAAQKSIEVRKAELDKKMYTDMQEGVLNSKLYKRLPGKMAEHINEAVKDSPIENIYISKDAFTQYFQSKQLDPAEEAGKLGLTAEFERASETGSDIVLPTGSWVSKVVGTEHYAGLQDDVRFSPEMQSFREEKADQKALKEAIKAEVESRKKAEAEGKEIIDDVYNQLVAAGTPKNVASYQSEVYRVLNVLAQRSGKSPQELYKKYGLKIVSSQESGSYFPETGSSGPNYSLNKDENGMYQYDSIILENMKTAVAQGEAGGIVLPDGRRSQSTFPEFFKNKGLKKKDVLKIIEKYSRGEMLSEGQKETLNMMYADAVDAVNRGQSYFQTRSGKYETQYDAETESIVINNDEVKAAGIIQSQENFIDDFVNGPYKKKIKIEKLGLTGDEKVFSIESIDVDQSKRRSGFGTEAVKSLEESAALMGAEVVVLNASPIGTMKKAQELPGLIKFYEGLGYKLIRKSKENAEMYKVLDKPQTFFQSKDDTLDLYHGTKSKDQFPEFKLNDVVGTLGRGVYTSEDKNGLASVYGKNGRLIELQVKNKNKIIDSSTDLSEQDVSKIKEAIDPKVFKILESEDDLSGNYASFFRRLQLRVNEYNSMYDDKIEDQTIKASEALDVIGLRTPGREVIIFNPKNIINKNGSSLFQGTKKPKGSITFGLNDQTVINLFKEKDQSTFLHESGHLFLKVFQDLVLDPNATESIKADGAEILKYLGAESWAQISDKKNDFYHEKWARSFEAYLMRGEAPSPTIQKAFNTFFTWLTTIYKKVSALDVELTPEIIGVMDRMIATEEEINEAQVQSGLTNLFKDPIAAGMNEKDAQKYKEAIEGAQVFAEAKLMSKLMEELNKKQSDMYRKKYDQYRSEARKELTKRKIYDVISVLKTGKHISGTEAFPPIKLDKKSVIDQFGKEMAALMPKKIFGKDGTELDIGVVADTFGYESAAMLAQELVETAPIDDVSRQMANERIKAEFPELYKEPEIKGEALMAIHNEKRGEFLKFELEFLQKNYPAIFKDAIRRTVKRSPLDQQVRAEAQKIVGGMSVKDLKPYLYLRAEANASKEAGIKLAKGDIKGAFEAKRREYLNYEIYRAVVDAKADVEKSVKDFKKFFEKTEDMAKKRDPDLINAAKAVLEKFGLSREAIGSPFEYLKKIKEYDPQAYDPIEAIVMSAIDGAQDYTSVNYDKFSEMRDVVLTLWDMAKNVKQMQIDGQSVEIETVKNDLSAQLDKHVTEATPAIKQELTDKEKFKTKLLNAAATLRRVESWSDLMDLGSAGPFKKYIWNPVSEAIVEYRLAKKPVMEKYKDILKKYEDLFAKETIIAEGLGGFIFKDKSRLIMAVLHTGNPSNKQKLLRGWGWGTVDENGVLDSAQFDAQIAQFQQDGTLTKRDYEMMTEIWTLMGSLKPGAQRAHKKMFGYYFNEITAEEIQTPFGTFPGGYIPAKVDVFTNEDAQIRKEREEFEQGNNSFQFPTTGKGFTKSRVEAYAAPLALDMNLLGNHIDGVLRFTHIEPIIKQTARIVNNKEFRAKLKEVDAAAGSEMLVPWLQRSALQKVTTPSESGLGRLVDSAATKLRSGIAMQFMVGNFTNAMQQVTGIAVAAAKVQPKHLLFGMKEYLTNRKELLKLIADKSKWMGTVQDQTLYETQEAVNQVLTNPSTFENMQNFAKTHTYFLQSATQNFVNTIVWIGAYNQAVESGATEVEAVRAADGAVRQTQGTNNPEDVSRFEVGTPTYRLFTQFAGYFNMLSNLQATEFQKIMKELGLKKGAGKLAYLYFSAVMIPAVGAQLIVQLMSGKDFDEDEDGLADDLMALFFGSQFKTATAQVPFVGPIATSVYNRFNKQAYDDRLSFSPVISVLEAGAGVPYAIYKDASKEELSKRTAKDFLNIVGIFSGLPTGPAGRPIGYLMDVSSGEANPSGPVDYTRGLISGQKGQ